MRWSFFALIFAVGCGTWPKEKPGDDPNSLRDLLVGVNFSLDSFAQLATLTRTNMPGLNLARVDMTVVSYEDVRSEPYKSQYGCKGNYIGCTDVQKDVSHSLVAWDDDPNLEFLSGSADTFAHELAHVWLFQTTGNSDKHHRHTEIFGRDDTGKVVDLNALVPEIATQWATEQWQAYMKTISSGDENIGPDDVAN